MSEPKNNPADIFASDERAASNPATYSRRERTVSPESVRVGMVNAVVNLKKKTAMLRSLARARRRSKSGCQRR